MFASIAAACFVLALILLHGCATRPPTKLEQGLFNIETNYQPMLVVKTNVITVTTVQTNVVPVTNTIGVIQYQTNLVPLLVYQTNTVISTNMQESYLYTKGEGAQRIQDAGGMIGNLFGAGGVVTTGLGALFGLWGYLRSKKSLVTAANIAQTVETMREFVKQLPGGVQYDNELVNWMQAHQADAGVLNQVIALLQQQVSNPDARVAAQQVMDTIRALKNL